MIPIYGFPAVRRSFRFLFLVSILVALAGCTPKLVKVGLPYRASLSLPPASGTVFLSGPQQEPARRTEKGEWIIGEIRDTDGKDVGDVVTESSPGDLLVRALAEELRQAGYRVETVSDVPKDAAKGIRLQDITVSADESLHLARQEVKSEARLSVEVIREGNPVVRLKFVARGSDSGVRWSRKTAEKVASGAVSDLMRQAVPEIVRELEKMKGGANK